MISIIIATKNGGKFLKRSIASIETQTEKDYEVIVISDGSTDNTPDIVREMQLTRPWLKLIELNKNIGPGLARDIGIRESIGEYVAIIDDDDEWIDPDKISLQKEFLNKNTEYVLVGSKETDFVNEDGTLLFTYQPEFEDKKIRQKILLENQFITSSVMFRKDSYIKSGGFSPMYLAEDYDLWMKMMKLGKVANLDNCKTRYYTRKSGAHRSNATNMNKVIINLVKKYKCDFPKFWLAIIKAYLRLVLKSDF